MVQNIAHGKEVCRWCDGCGTLLLGELCSACGSAGREFKINSPGDVRPCMGDSIELVLGLFREAFGTDAPLRGRSIWLNKVPGEDRTDEIIADGSVLGVMRFDLRLDRMVLELRQPGADMFYQCVTKNVVWFWGMSGHIKGKIVPGENLNDIVGEFSKGDPLIVRKGQRVGPAVALEDSRGMRSSNRALRIRDFDQPAPEHKIPKADLDTFVSCNRGHLRRIQRRAVREIRAFLEERNRKGLPVTVSFSGGKDSLAAYGLVSQASDSVELMYIDTGLEFPETTEYVKSFAERHGNRLHIASGGNGFWENVDVFGPPAKDFRWCCKVCKLGPITDLINSDFPNGTVTVEGNRWLESYVRSGIEFVTRNPFVPNQVNLNPIRSWTAAEVWLYILSHDLEYNPLYDMDFERIGCYLCPSCLSSEWKNTGRIHPELYSSWKGWLHAYAESHGLPSEYVDSGFWRWKVLSPKMVQLSEEMHLDLRPRVTQGPSMRIMKKASSCAAGGYSMEAVVTVQRVRDFSYVADALRTMGDVIYDREYEIALLRLPIGRGRLFGGGQISVNSPDEANVRKIFEHAVKALIRAQMCTSCGICEKGCPRHAITMSGGMRVDSDRCTSCGRCERSCMVVHYYDKLMSVTPIVSLHKG